VRWWIAALLAVLLLAPGYAYAQRLGQVNVYGKAADWLGRPVAGATVEVYSGGALYKTAATGPDGVFHVWLDPGVYTFKVKARGLQPVEVTAKIPGGEALYGVPLPRMAPAVQVVAPGTGFRLEAGGEYEIPLRLVNKGVYWESVRVALEAPEGWSMGLYKSGVEVTATELAPGAGEDYVLKIRVPPSARGNYTAVLHVSFSRSYGLELRFTVGEPEARAVSVEPGAVVAAPGGLVEATVTVRNPYSWPVNFTLRLASPKGWSVKLLDSEGRVVAGGSLPPKGSFKARLEVVPRGSGEVGVEACMPGLCSRAALRVEARAGMDVLVFEEGFVAASTRPGRVARFKLVLSNLGVTGTLVELGLRGLPANYTWRLVDEEGNVFRELYVKPGEKAVFYVEVRPPLGERAKTLQLGLVARGSSSVANATLSLSVLNRVELEVVTENFYVEVRPGGSAVFRYTVANRGDAPVSSLRLAASGAPRGWRVEVRPSSVAVLPPGGNATFTVTVSVPGDARVGDYYIRLTLTHAAGSEERLLHVAVVQSGGAALTGWLMVAAVIVIVALIYLRYGRR